MSNEAQAKPYTVKPDEKVTPIMTYTKNEMSWGEVITKEIIRVGAWLRTDMAPSYIQLHLAQHLKLSSDAPDHPMPIKEMFIPMSQVISLHVLPSVKEPLYYDPNQPNRTMEPVTVFIDLFQFRGSLFLSSNASVEQFLDVTREIFIPLHNVEITHPKMPPPGVIKVPFTVIRQELATFVTGHI